MNLARECCLSSAGGVGGAFARPQGSTARSRNREQGVSPFAHVPRSLVSPATSPRCSPQRRPCRAKGVGGAFARPQGPAARSRSRQQVASFFAHLPRPRAPPATSPHRSPQLRFVLAIILFSAAPPTIGSAERGEGLTETQPWFGGGVG
jgi:hypothetical protein